MRLAGSMKPHPAQEGGLREASARLGRRAEPLYRIGMRRHGRLLLAPFALLPLAGAAHAENPPDPSSIAAFAAAHADCLEWGDGCFVCTREVEKGGFACSVPGPACLPKPLACLLTKAPHPQAK